MGIYTGESNGGLTESEKLYVGTDSGGFDEIASAYEWVGGHWVELFNPVPPTVPAQTATFSTPGAIQIYQPPAGATRLVIIALGGGGNGGRADVDERAAGGSAGGWGGVTLYLPLEQQYYVTVGAARGDSFVSAMTGPDALRLVTGKGGTNGSSNGGSSTRQAGKSPGTYNYAGLTRIGGAAVSGSRTGWGDDGNAPGGGGAGGGDDSPGGAGAPGRVWFTAYFD